MPYKQWRTRRPRKTCPPLTYGFQAIVAEKPKAAEKIASALGDARKCWSRGIPYWIVRRNGRLIVVASSAGHMYGPYSGKRGFPVYEFEWRPLWEYDKSSRHLRKFYEVLAWILPKAGSYVNACDYDIEGSVIGYMIIEDLGDPRRAKRMVFSSLSPIELRRAYENLQPLDIEMVEAGKARHEMDWLWGINVSRALMEAVRKTTGRRVILSAGRVQTPTLAEAVRRWLETRLRVPQPVFNLNIILEKDGVEFPASPSGWRPSTRKAAQEIARGLRTRPYMTVKRVNGARIRVRPPPAFNLGDLQAEAARLYKFSPLRTQKLAEDLYLEALISYPRTNSQKLPPTIDYARIIRSLKAIPSYSSLASRLLAETRGSLRPVQGRKDDPAHPAIHPTGIPPKNLDKDHFLVYDLIVRRFLAAFSTSAEVSRIHVALEDTWGRPYEAKGVVIVREGWYYYYPFLRPREARIPPLKAGDRVRIARAGYTTRWTAPHPPLSKTELLKWMESVGIGTEATRARIIEVLFKRGYLESRGGKTVVTELGLMVSEIVNELFPELGKPDLTRRFEEYIEAIRTGKATRKIVVEETIRVLDRLLAEYSRRLESVGRKLAIALGVAEPEVKCAICGREAVASDPLPLCKYHLEALARIRKALPSIARALDTSQEEALRLLASRRGEAGQWVVEVARLLLERKGLAPHYQG